MRRRIDEWLFAEHRASARDLAAARVVVAGFLLLKLPRGMWIADLPQAFFNPPLSPAVLTDDFASTPVLAAANGLALVAALCLLLGYRTRFASIATTALFIGLQSLIFATGKIDHNVLSVLAPGVMASSGWGDVWSLDAVRGRVRHLEPDRGGGPSGV